MNFSKKSAVCFAVSYILDNGAKILLEKEKIEGDELNALIKNSATETPKTAQR